MALIPRISFLSNRKNCDIFLHSLRNGSLQHRCSYRVLTGFHCIKTLPKCQQLYMSSNGEPKQKREASNAESKTENQLSQRVRLKQAVRDYGATIIVFHIAISLTSLGISYIAISSGVDAIALLTHLGLPDSIISSKVAVEGSTFVMAYAVHKLFAPVRIAITLSAAPFIVRYLRKINLIKPPK